jgi:hypothetical protein
MCADICIHDKGDGNPHAHVTLTMRPFEPDGSWGTKQKKEYILDQQGEKIYDPKKRQYRCRSVPTTNWNEQTKARINKLNEWLKGEAKTTTPSLPAIITEILNSGEGQAATPRYATSKRRQRRYRSCNQTVRRSYMLVRFPCPFSISLLRKDCHFAAQKQEMLSVR